MDLNEKGWENTDWLHLAQDRANSMQHQALKRWYPTTTLHDVTTQQKYFTEYL
jgi:hypothetical protein